MRPTGGKGGYLTIHNLYKATIALQVPHDTPVLIIREIPVLVPHDIPVLVSRDIPVLIIREIPVLVPYDIPVFVPHDIPVLAHTRDIPVLVAAGLISTTDELLDVSPTPHPLL